MAAVVAVAAPLLLLSLSTLLTDPEPPHHARPPTPASQAAAEQVLRSVLASQRSSSREAVFLRHRALAEQFAGVAAAHLRHVSPLFEGAIVAHDGGAFEDTRVSDDADFDMYTILAAGPLRRFELRRGADGSFEVRLQPGAARQDLPEDLVNMLTADGRLDAARFRQWTTECLMYALYEAAEDRPDLHPVVYQTRGAPGVDLTAADGATVEIDLTAKLPLPPTRPSVFRPAALRPCGTPLVPAGSPPPWHLYSYTPAAGAEPRFGGDAPQLELRWLQASPLLRDVTRLLKTLRAKHDWYHRFGVMSFNLKQAAFWSRAEQCGETRLLPATVAALRGLESALRAGRLENFWFAAPAENTLRSRVMTARLANEVAECVETLTSGDTERVRRLFRP